MLFLSSTFYIFNAYLYENKKYIYLFPLLLLIWSNGHSSVNLIFAITGAYVAGALFQQALNKKFHMEAPYLTGHQLRVFLSIIAFSLLLSLINPNGIQQYLEGVQVIGTDFFKQELSELLPPTGKLKGLIVFFETTLLASFIVNKKRASLTDLFAVIPFLIMPFLARRFFYLPFIVGAPILCKNISTMISNRSPDNVKLVRGTVFFLLGCLVIALKIHWHEISSNSITNFGSGFNYVHMPKEAVDFMDRNEITGRTFNSFAFGQYIIWTGHPQRTVFVDARGAISVDLLEKLLRFREHPEIITELFQKYHFESLLIPAKGFATGLKDDILKTVDTSFSHPDWALVYWDDKSLLYVRRNGPFSKLVKNKEYHYINPDMSPQVFLSTLGGYSERTNKMAEIKRNLTETNSYTAHLFASLLHFASARYPEAVIELETVSRSDSEKFRQNAFGLLGDVYFKMGQWDKSLKNYFQASGYEKAPSMLHNIGKIYQKKSDDEKAVRYFERAIEIDPNYRPVYPDIISRYKSLGKTEEAATAQAKLDSLNSDQAAKRYFTNGVTAHLANDFDMAISEYSKSLRENPNIAITNANIGFVYLYKNMPEKSLKHFQKAIEIDPDHANAYYGLGLVYRAYGDTKQAIANLKKYTTLEPRGHYYRMAKSHLQELTTQSQ